MNEPRSIKKGVMEAISRGAVKMRPRWHFIFFSAFAIVGVGIVILTLIYAASLLVFFMRDSGAWFAPSFGSRGWSVFFRAMPWLLIGLIAIFIALLHILVRRYSFVYKKPLVVSLAGIVSLPLLGGYAVASTPLHRHMEFYVDHGMLPRPFDGPVKMLYRGSMRTKHPHDVLRGHIVGTTTEGFVIASLSSTSTILISKKTRMPYGEGFETGTMIVVVGDADESGNVQAFGIMALDEE